MQFSMYGNQHQKCLQCAPGFSSILFKLEYIILRVPCSAAWHQVRSRGPVLYKYSFTRNTPNFSDLVVWEYSGLGYTGRFSTRLTRRSRIRKCVSKFPGARSQVTCLWTRGRHFTIIRVKQVKIDLVEARLKMSIVVFFLLLNKYVTLVLITTTLVYNDTKRPGLNDKREHLLEHMTYDIWWLTIKN